MVIPRIFIPLLSLLVLLACPSSALANHEDKVTNLRKDAQILLDQKSYKEATQAYVHLLRNVNDKQSGLDFIKLIEACTPIEGIIAPSTVLDVTLMPKLPDAGQDANQAITATGGTQNKQVAAQDRFIDITALIGTYTPLHKDNPDFLMDVADYIIHNMDHQYKEQGGVIYRPLRIRGERNSCDTFDRITALRIYLDLLNRTDKKAKPQLAATIMMRFANQITPQKARRSWRNYPLPYCYLTAKTDLTKAPLITDDNDSFNDTKSLPIDKQGNPIFFSPSSSWETALNDGERIQYLFEEASRIDPKNRLQYLAQKALWLHNFFSLESFIDEHPDKSTPLWQKRDQLKDNETLAFLGDTPTLITLPPMSDMLGILKFIAQDSSLDQGEGEKIGVDVNLLIARELATRNRLTEAVTYLDKALSFVTNQQQKDRILSFKQKIISPSGQFIRESSPLVVPQTPKDSSIAPSIDIQYRNTDNITLYVRQINQQMICDEKLKLKKNNSILSHILEHAVNPKDPKEASYAKYILPKIITHSYKVPPTPDFRDKTTSLPLPVFSPGLYLVEARLSDHSRIYRIVSINNFVLIQQPIPQGILWVVADAITGAPLQGVSLNGVAVLLKSGSKKQDILPFSGMTDGNGTFITSLPKNNRRQNAISKERYDLFRTGNPQSYSIQRLICIAKHQDNYATWGIFDDTGMIYLNDFEAPCSQTKDNVELTFLSSQPLYRPGQMVKALCRLVTPTYDNPTLSQWANTNHKLTIIDPQGNKSSVNNLPIKTDSTGAFNISYQLPKDAPLGQYTILLNINGSDRSLSVNFSVEEYKKPEFEVLVKPSAPVIKLGNPVSFTITANYYAGGPVAGGSALVNVEATPRSFSWRPFWRWSQLVDTINNSWRYNDFNPISILNNQKVTLDQQGKANITLPTIKDLTDFGKKDIEYKVTVSVTDASLREVEAESQILAPVQAFETSVTLPINYVRAKSPIPIDIQATTITNTPIPNAKGKVRICQLILDPNNQVQEQELSQTDISVNEQGIGTLNIAVPQAGSYRLCVTLTDSQGQCSKGSTDFLAYEISGQSGQLDKNNKTDQDLAPFPSPEIKFTTERRDYHPGDKAQILVTSSNPDAFIWAFIRSGLTTETMSPFALKHQSGQLSIPVTLADMPNFFVSGFTISMGKLFYGQTMVFLPPNDKTLQIEARPNQQIYTPEEEGTIRVHVTDHLGNPVQENTQLTLTVYDQALNYFVAPQQPLINQLWRTINYKPTETANLSSLYFISSNDSFLDSSLLGRNIHIDLLDSTSSTPFSMPFKSKGIMNTSVSMCYTPSQISENEQDTFSSGTLRSNTQEPALIHDTVKVRTNFLDNIKWCGSLTTDKNGDVVIPVSMPDNLTTWEIKAWGISEKLAVGEATAHFRCTKDFLVSLQTPRFLVDSDTVTISAIVRNQTDQPTKASVTLAPENGVALTKSSPSATQEIDVPAHGQAVVNWTILANTDNIDDTGHLAAPSADTMASFTVTAKSPLGNDAMETSIPILVHGMKQLHTFSSAMTPEQKECSFDVKIPSEIRIQDTTLNINVSPSIALTMIDALPYLAQYPHGCVEQTLNRFLPALIVRQTMQNYGIKLDELAKHNYGDPDNVAALQQLEARLENNPIFSNAKLDKIATSHLNKLADMQLSDGSWGWFGGLQSNSNPMMTAIIYQGLCLTKQLGTRLPIPMGCLDKAKKWLVTYEKQQVALLNQGDKRRNMTEQEKGKSRAEYRMTTDSLDARIRHTLQQSGIRNDAMLDYLNRDCLDMPVYGRLLLAQTLVIDIKAGHDNAKKDYQRIMKSVEQFLTTDDSLQTAHLQLPNTSYWWHWYGDDISTQTAYLDILCSMEPQSPKLAQVAKWIVLNRANGNHWDSTLNTANAVNALAKYLSITKEGMEPMEAEVSYQGKTIGTIKTTKDTLLTANQRIILRGHDALPDQHGVDHKMGKITIKRLQGQGNIYIDASLSVFTLQDPLPAAGNALCVNRAYYLVQSAQRDTLGQADSGAVITRPVKEEQKTLLPDNANVKSGDIIEVELIINLKNEVEYLFLADPKPAGCEAKNITSGYSTSGNVFAYREAGDENTRFFISKLPSGTHKITFRLRAERPGTFSALPTVIEAMYAPSLRGNSKEEKLSIQE
ncbi:MAG: alpha-2-macroglobulin family protein [Akkermansia sp.]